MFLILQNKEGHMHILQKAIYLTPCEMSPLCMPPSPCLSLSWSPAMTWHFSPRLTRAVYKVCKLCHLVFIMCTAGYLLLCMKTVHSDTIAHWTQMHDLMQQSLIDPGIWKIKLCVDYEENLLLSCVLMWYVTFKDVMLKSEYWWCWCCFMCCVKCSCFL